MCSERIRFTNPWPLFVDLLDADGMTCNQPRCGCGICLESVEWPCSVTTLASFCFYDGSPASSQTLLLNPLHDS